VSTEGAAGVEVLAAPSALLVACASEPPDASDGEAHEASVPEAELSVVSVAAAEVSVVVPQTPVVGTELSVLSVAAHETSVAVAEVFVVVPQVSVVVPELSGLSVAAHDASVAAEVFVVVSELSVLSVAAHDASVPVVELSVVSVVGADVSVAVAEPSVVSVVGGEVSVPVAEPSVVSVAVSVLAVEAAGGLSAGIESEDETALSAAGCGGSSARAVAANTDAQKMAASTAAVQCRIPGAPRRSQRGGWMLGTPTALPSISSPTIASYPFGFSSIAVDRPGARVAQCDWKPEKRQPVHRLEVDQPQVETERYPQSSPTCVIALTRSWFHALQKR
jgi:hypothetical protein